MHSRDRGSALFLSVVLLTFLLGMAMAIYAASGAQSQYLSATASDQRVFRLADDALGKAKVAVGQRLRADKFTYDGAKDVEVLAEQGVRVTLTDLSHKTFRVTSVATRGGRSRTLEMILRIEYFPVPAPGMGAVLGRNNVQLTGNISVSGNDHDPDGVRRTDPLRRDVPAILLDQGTLYQGGDIGSARIAGSGTSYQSVTTATSGGGTFENNTTAWAPEGNSADNTTGSDPRNDGIDNDGDGMVDESGFPTRPAGLFGLTSERSLKEAAVASKTYFTTVGAYHAWLYGNPGAVPPVPPGNASGRVVYLDLAPSTDHGQLDLPNNPPPARPAIVIVAGRPRDETYPPTSTSPPTGDVTVGPVHIYDPDGSGPLQGKYQGLFVADTVEHMNAGGTVVGSVVSFNADSRTHFGNGTMNILFSSEVMANLPGVKLDTEDPEVLLWWERR